MKVRKYQDKDKESLVELWEKVFPDDPPHNEPSNLIDTKLVVDDLIFVTESEVTITGACMAGYDGHRGWLYSVAVLPEFRRSGLGSLLVQHAIQSLRNWVY